MTPTGNPFDVGLSISTAAFNQVLRAGVEKGILRFDITELDLGAGPLPLTAGLLALFVPEFSNFDPGEPTTISVRPTLAPIVCGLSGPGGELAEVRFAGLTADVLVDGASAVTFVVDTSLGVDLEVDLAEGEILPQLGALTSGGIDVTIVKNPIHTDEENLQELLPEVLAVVLPDLLSGIGSFELPEFQGLQPTPIEVSREGRVVTIYTTLGPAL